MGSLVSLNKFYRLLVRAKKSFIEPKLAVEMEDDTGSINLKETDKDYNFPINPTVGGLLILSTPDPMIKREFPRSDAFQ